MSRRRGRTPPREWTPFRRAEAVHTRTREPAELEPDEELWVNSLYTVTKRTLAEQDDDGPGMVWLSIHRNDRKTIRDWRHLQRIKNELVGPECEGVELYPAESRLVDTSNQFHLWVCTEPGYQLPFGYKQRLVMDPEETAVREPGAVQRPFDETHEKESA